jgi:tripartite-type tricarboxylate transporter receptor subunit TctC
MIRTALAILGALVGASSLDAAAQNWPAKPIRVVIPITAGTGVDAVARRMSDEMQPTLGQPFVVDNRPGANFILGAEQCAHATPDGYTFCILTGDNTSLNPLIFPKLPYDPDKQLRGVTNLYFLIEGLLAKASLPANSIAELRALAVAKRGALNWATLGPSTTTDIARRWVGELWNTEFAGIPYKGGNLVTAAVASGEVDVARIGVYNALGLVKGGKVKVLAIGASKRSPVMPNVPTYSEAGLGDMPGRAWWGLFAPAGTPDAMVRRMNAEVVRLFREPKFAEWIDSQMVEIAVSSPEEFASFLRRDREQAAQMVQRFKIPKQ